MRRRMAAELKADTLWEVKHRRGGLVDIEFVAQYLQLRWARAHPSLLKRATAPVLREARRLACSRPPMPTPCSKPIICGRPFSKCCA